MLKEIGGAFLIENKFKRKKNNISEYINYYGDSYVYLNSGRSAIKYVAEKVFSKVALLPNYLCESMIQPFEELGFKIKFYNINEDFTIDIDSIKQVENLGLFMHMGYFGISYNNHINNLIKEYKQSGIIILEDLTHNFFSKFPIIYKSDYYIVSLRKWIGISGGAILISNQEKIELKKLDEYTIFNDIYFQADNLKKLYLKKQSETKKHLELYKSAEELLEKSGKLYGISAENKKIIENYNFDKMSKIRLRNYKLMNKILGKKKSKFENQLFTGSKIVPLFYPIKVNCEKRSLVKEFLVDNKIYPPIHWPKHLKYLKEFESQKLYNMELSIPIDQRYSRKDIVKVATTLIEIEKRDLNV